MADLDTLFFDLSSSPSAANSSLISIHNETTQSMNEGNARHNQLPKAKATKATTATTTIIPTSNDKPKKPFYSRNQIYPRRQLRACKICSIVQPEDDFLIHGCPNCPFIHYTNDQETLKDCTSALFDGMFAMNHDRGHDNKYQNTEKGDEKQTNSYVAKFYRVENYVRGIYAARVTGELPIYILEELDAKGIEYIPREETEEWLKLD